MKEKLIPAVIVFVLLAGGAAALAIGSRADVPAAKVATRVDACDACPLEECASCPKGWVCCRDDQGNILCCPIEDCDSCDPSQCPLKDRPCGQTEAAAVASPECPMGGCRH
jgi:hypothetical protein